MNVSPVDSGSGSPSIANAETNMTSIVIISIIATLGGFLFGFDSGVVNGTYDGLNLAFGLTSSGATDSTYAIWALVGAAIFAVLGTHYIRKEFFVLAFVCFVFFMWEARNDNSFRVGSILIGCAIGAFFAGLLADKYGRRGILILAAVLFILSAWGAGVATSSTEFILYRLIGGLAVGAASIICPAYISELVPASYRGKLSSIQQIAIITGLTAAFLSNYALAKAAGGSTHAFWGEFTAWRWMFWVGIVPGAIFLFSLLLIPESPRYLVASGNKEKAISVLTKLYGAKSANQTADEIKASLEADHKPQFSDLIGKTKNRIRPIVWVGIGLAVIQQFVGINVVFYYGAVLWQAAGFSENDALFINVGSGLVSIAACFITFFFVDKIGRKPLLLAGSIGMTVTLALVAYAFWGAPVDANGKLALAHNTGVLALVSANLYVIFFNLSWGPVCWIMLGEMFPNQIRGAGLAVAGFGQWIANFIITWTFPLLLASSLGLPGAYSIYAICSFLSIFFVIWWIKETKGVTLENMQG